MLFFCPPLIITVTFAFCISLEKTPEHNEVLKICASCGQRMSKANFIGFIRKQSTSQLLLFVIELNRFILSFSLAGLINFHSYLRMFIGLAVFPKVTSSHFSHFDAGPNRDQF